MYEDESFARLSKSIWLYGPSENPWGGPCRWVISLSAWAPTGMGKGALALPWKSWKVLSCKNSISEVSLNGGDAAFSVKEDREWLFHADYFISEYYKRIMFCTPILKENEGTPDAYPQILDL